MGIRLNNETAERPRAKQEIIINTRSIGRGGQEKDSGGGNGRTTSNTQWQWWWCPVARLCCVAASPQRSPRCLKFASSLKSLWCCCLRHQPAAEIASEYPFHSTFFLFSPSSRYRIVFLWLMYWSSRRASTERERGSYLVAWLGLACLDLISRLSVRLSTSLSPFMIVALIANCWYAVFTLKLLHPT